jgi:ADP-heptose:LPS heptosyltransferase
MKILVIRFSSMGDIVLTSPVLRCIKQQIPGAQVHYLTKKTYVDLVRHSPYVDRVFGLEGDLQPLIPELLKERYDVVIDLHRNLRTRYVKALLRQAFNSHVVCHSFHKLNLRKWLLTALHIRTLPDVSIVDRYMETVRTLGVKNDGRGLELFIPEDACIGKDDLPLSHSLGFAALVIGGQHATKKMPVAKWQEVCRQIPFPVVLLGGPEDAAEAEQIRSVDPVKVYSACGKFSVLESADIVRRSRLVISHDTGLMHVAAAFKKPIISLWGNTVPEFGMFPYYGFNNLKSRVAPESVMLEVKGLGCRPCSKIGYAQCPKKHFRCMNEQSVPAILSHAERLWREGGRQKAG